LGDPKRPAAESQVELEDSVALVEAA